MGIRIEEMEKVGGVNILWIDDEPEKLLDLARNVNVEQPRINISVAPSLDEADEILSEGDIDAAVVDLKLDQTEPEGNGAVWLSNLNHHRPSLPSFIFSGWITDPLYAPHVALSYPRRKIWKRVDLKFVRPYQEDPHLSHIVNDAIRYRANKVFRPDIIPFDVYSKNVDMYHDVLAAHAPLYKEYITEYMRRNDLRWAIMCGKEVCKESSTLADYPSIEEVYAIGQEYNHIPFIYSAPLSPEEVSSWSDTADTTDNLYPTLSVIVDGTSLVDDFDTGAPNTHISSELVRGLDPLERFTEGPIHLGKPYSYLVKRVNLGISADGYSMNREIPVVVVHEWNSTGFVDRNPKRRALLGRDILDHFTDITVELNATTKATRIRLSDHRQRT